MDMNLHIPVSKFDYIEDNDNHFLKVRLQAIANGENLNRSDFDKDGMDISKDSFRGKPLLCAFPKNRYTNEYKIGDGHNSSDIKYDSEYDEFYHSYLDPNSERMVGYIPFDSNIDIEFIDGKYWICMDAVILKRYNYELVKDILNKKNGKSKRDNKRISVEIEVLESHMRKHETENYDVEVIDKFKGMGVTILFDDTQEAVVGANLKAFAESEQYNKFKSFMQYTFDNKEFINKDDIGTGDKITIKKDKVSDTPWGDIDKSELYKKALNASNYKAVIRFIYAKVEPGWEENPSQKLKYPIGQISGDEAFYNEGGLSSALGYSKKMGESEVTDKVERIRKRLGLDEDSDKFAVEKNKDIVTGDEIISEYPDSLEMSANEKDFELTVNQKKEIINIALSEASEYEEDDDKDSHRRYWLCDLDDTYIYVQDCENDYRMYRIKYILNQDSKTAEVYIETKEEVICSGYETIGQEGEDSVKKEFKTDETLAKEKEEMQAEEKMEKNPDEEKMEEKPEEEKMAENPEEKMSEEKMEEKPEEKMAEEKTPCMEETELEAEYSEEVKAGCHAANASYICNAGEYAIYSIDRKLYASKSDNFEEKFEVSLDMRFDVQTIKTGGVNDGEIQTVAPIKVSFADNYIELSNKMAELSKEFEISNDKVKDLQGKLDTYKCKELLNKFEEISFDANVTVTERTEWKNRINKNEFSSENELVEKFGGFVFKKSIENKFSAYTSETIKEKVNNKKSYEELIDQYMTDK